MTVSKAESGNSKGREIASQELQDKMWDQITSDAADIAIRLGVRGKLTIITQDAETKRVFGLMADAIDASTPKGREYGIAELVNIDAFVEILPTIDMQAFIDAQIERYPDMKFVLYQELAAQLAQNSVEWVSQDHYQLLGRSPGAVDVYTPYQRSIIPDLPPGASGYFFIE